MAMSAQVCCLPAAHASHALPSCTRLDLHHHEPSECLSSLSSCHAHHPASLSDKPSLLHQGTDLPSKLRNVIVLIGDDMYGADVLKAMDETFLPAHASGKLLLISVMQPLQVKPCLSM